MNFGSPGVTGSACANELCEAADLVIGVGTRFQDFTTGSWSLFRNPDRKLVIDQPAWLRRAEARRGRRRRRRPGDARTSSTPPSATCASTRPDARSRTDWHAAVARVTARAGEGHATRCRPTPR